MPALTAPQLALLRSQPQTSEWYIHPVVPVTVFAARINDAAITVGARTITYDTVTIGAFTDIKAGQTLWVGTAPNTYNVARIRVRSATSAHLIVAENSDVAWADNYYLTVKREWLCWSIRPFINSSGTVFKDYDIAYTDQTTKWPPVAMMGDPVCKPWAGNPTTVYFDGSESYATSPGATITGYAWDFGDGTTSTAATPGNHNYTSAGDRWASLTVTDSNGKTCVTYRPVSLPDPATLYTAKFEEQSLDAAIDTGWTGQCSVFAPLATIAEFPERAPVFLIAVNTYGGTAGSVGYPRGRENVVLFGYIQDDSVEETPETSSIQFTMESVDKVAARAAAITTFVADATTPANWDEGLDLNIFRSFVYLLAFQSTLFQIADVRLFNDTTLIKIARFPEDNLWNMFAQFARGARLMRVGVTRTGRVIVGRDPNLLPIASRGVVTTVCQLQDGDWADTVTIPEHPYPATSFLCLSGISYDGDPAHDPTPLFGMSPGHPPKEYGTSREIHDLALVSQIEAETLAGLSVGQDNNAFGEVNIPLWANWIGAFDPAYQEYVTAPVFGFVTNRGVMLTGASLIVRKVSIGFDWEAGAMRSTLTCEVYSYPDIGMVGDCYTTDAPPPPIQNVPPIIPQQPPPSTQPAPVLTSVTQHCYPNGLGDSDPALDLAWTWGGAGTPTYYIEQSVYPTSGFSVKATTGSTSFSTNLLTSGRRYYYRVRALVGGVYTLYSNIVSQTAPFCTPVLTIADDGCATATLSWLMKTGVMQYQIERSAVGSGSGFSLIATVAKTAPATQTYDDTPSTRGTWYYRIRSQTIYGVSAYSNEVSDRVGLAAWHNSLIVVTASHVWEWSGATFGIGYTPTPTDITGNILGNILAYQRNAFGEDIVLTDDPGYPAAGTLWRRTGTSTWAGGNNAGICARDAAMWSFAWFNENGSGPHGAAFWGGRACFHAGAFPCDTPHFDCAGANPCSFPWKIHWTYQAAASYEAMIGSNMLLYNSNGTVTSDCSLLSNGAWVRPIISEVVTEDCVGSDTATPDAWDSGFGILLSPFFAAHFSPYEEIAQEAFNFFNSRANIVGAPDKFFNGSAPLAPAWWTGFNPVPAHFTDPGGRIWAWNNQGLFYSDDAGGSWTDTTVDAGGVFGLNAPNASAVVRSISGTTLYKSIDYGANWTTHPGIGGGTDIFTVDGEIDNLYAFDGDGALWLSDDEGAHWCKVWDGDGSTVLGIYVDAGS